MNQNAKTCIAAIVLCFNSFCSFAQQKQTRIPAWISDKGYWVVESNIHSPLEHIVWFYSNNNVLMYKEKLAGIKLDPNKRRVKMKLKKALEASASVWEQKGAVEENKNYVVAIFK